MRNGPSYPTGFCSPSPNTTPHTSYVPGGGSSSRYCCLLLAADIAVHALNDLFVVSSFLINVLCSCAEVHVVHVYQEMNIIFLHLVILFIMCRR